MEKGDDERLECLPKICEDAKASPTAAILLSLNQ